LFSVDEGEGAQVRYGLVESVAGEHGGEGLTEFLPGFSEEKQRDRLGRQQRGVDEQRFGGGMELPGLFDRECEGFATVSLS
jgi:hypothetical protein